MKITNDSAITSNELKKNQFAIQRATKWVPDESTGFCDNVFYATRSQDFVTECPNNTIGSVLTYIKAYFSPASQNEANDLALADSNFELEGQAYANQNGICSTIDGAEGIFDQTYSPTYS